MGYLLVDCPGVVRFVVSAASTFPAAALDVAGRNSVQNYREIDRPGHWKVLENGTHMQHALGGRVAFGIGEE